MGTRYPVTRTARRITYKLQTHDVRTYLFEDAVRRTRSAVTRAGGELRGGVYAPPKQIKRWCVLRSPHVNKKSREHFWMVTHKRVFKWDAPAAVDKEAPVFISSMLPETVAIRVTEERPGLMALKDVFNTISTVKEARVEKKDQRTASTVEGEEEASAPTAEVEEESKAASVERGKEKS